MNRPQRALRAVETLREARPQLLLLSSVAMMMMFVRLIFAPLLLEIQGDLAIGPARAARFFLFISIGYTGAMLASGFVAKRINHRGEIIVGGTIWSAGLLLVGLAPSVGFADVAFAVLGIGAGFYPPSGVAAASDLADERIRPRAIALHEVGPTSAFVLAPLFVNVMLGIGSWRTAVFVAAALSALLTLLYAWRGRTGCIPGEPPHISNIAAIIKMGRFWALLVFFLLAASATMGVYSIMPTFLVREHGIRLATVNSILGASRVSGIVMVLVAGLFTERFGVRRTITAVLVVTGLLTILVGLFTGRALLVAVFLQPVVISVYFPAAIVAMAEMTAPAMRNVIVSIMIPVVNLVSSGIYPSIMGALLEQSSVGIGFVVTGALMVGSVVLFPLLWGADGA